MTVEQLKAEAYDILVKIELLQLRLRQISQEIAKNPQNEQKEPS